jgi:hypothetical protein
MEFQKLSNNEIRVLWLRCRGEYISFIALEIHANESEVQRIQARAFTKLKIPGKEKERFKNFQNLGGCSAIENLTLDDIQNWGKRKYEIFGSRPESDESSTSTSTPPSTSTSTSTPTSTPTPTSTSTKEKKQTRPYGLYILIFSLLLVSAILVLDRLRPFLPFPVVTQIVVITAPSEPTQGINEPTQTLTLKLTDTVEPTTAFTLTPVEIVIAPPTQILTTDTPEPTFTSTSTIITEQDSTMIVTSTFDGLSTDGWTVDPGKQTELTNPGVGGNTSGGDDDGHLRAAPRSTGVSYYVAPPKFYGDWRQFLELKFDIWSQGGNYFTEEHGFMGDIYLANGPLEVWRLIPYRPPETWETIVIPLTDDGNWVFGVGTMRLEDVLSNVTDFRIRAEYGVNIDFSGLDNVSLRK